MAERRRIQPPDLPDPQRYSLGWRTGNTIYLAGAIGTDAAGNVAGPDIKSQARAAFRLLERVLAEAGGALRDVVKTTVFITDMRYRDGYSEVRGEFFPDNPPASTLVQVVALAVPGALIEIEAIAVVD